MNPKGTKSIGVALDEEYHNFIEKIITQTKETKVNFFKRIIKKEYENTLNGIVDDSISSRILNVENIVKEILLGSKEDTKSIIAIRNASSRIYSSTLVTIKELLRTMHFLSEFFSKGTSVNEDKMNLINSLAEKNAIETFSTMFELVSKLQTKEIVELLKNKSKGT